MSRQFILRGGDMYAEVSQFAAAVRVLRHDGRDLVAGWPPEGPVPFYSGTLLAPWPNRIDGARYTFGGVTHHLTMNEEARGNALHGLVADVRWLPVEMGPSHVRLAHTITPSPGYPFTLDLRVLHHLTPEGLTTTLTAENTGERAAPYGCAPHPWLFAGEDVEDYELLMPADRVLLPDERMLPASLEDVSGTPYDFRKPRRLGAEAVDHTFTGLRAEEDGLVRVRVRGPEGGVELSWRAAELPWAQVCSGTGFGYRGLAVEPMTCPPDAFNSGVDLVVLRPGETAETSWTLAPL
ncbi:aldose 1-epimerase family protein [Streptosporangium saharense]|uniref:Aldose 1-epimerase n=1 Tax=Streptosporangium saharense TaxID=1706840 RepID=A0A7W7QL07_9ACTN|nr:aldose 1-epimerase family protein [Streptosporangium saharense]MBB4915535.1 aldose 1-epimerase [Streptosporangium saharense]